MRECSEEGNQYFLLHNAPEGGIGHLPNHSCGPNCYVTKWAIEDCLRMDIFAKRDIQQHEEITFNHSINRYGFL